MPSKRVRRQRWLDWVMSASLPELLAQLSRIRADLTVIAQQEQDIMNELAVRRGQLMAAPKRKRGRYG